ncbi:TIGR00730 family Rossman fold protein [Simonsiella muelleri]|uniref:LOG family protein n=1 Tax=Simonsiella muelleri TaxID=72 RepID=UPI0023F42BBE|nr:TIGR00730 family Rossman fold protein [Simonsiella muelleri]
MTQHNICTEVTEADHAMINVRHAVSIYGSARLPETSPEYQFTEQLAHRLSQLGYSIISGGGPSIMQAANKGAFGGRGQSIGLNIVLPHEQKANEFQDISLQFDNFSARKATFVKYSQAHLVMAGGFGTLDELFECLTQVQTRKVARCPIILVGREFWQGLMDWIQKQLMARNLINQHELDYLYLTDDADEIVDILQKNIPLD